MIRNEHVKRFQYLYPWVRIDHLFPYFYIHFSQGFHVVKRGSSYFIINNARKREYVLMGPYPFKPHLEVIVNYIKHRELLEI